MNKLLTIIVLAISITTFGQDPTKDKSPIETVNSIFKKYIKQTDGMDSQENKDEMAKALTSLQLTNDPKNLPLLINVWMYYDPTDFETRKLVEPVFHKDIPATIAAIGKRLKKRKKWESDETAPYSDLITLKEKLKKDL